MSKRRWPRSRARLLLRLGTVLVLLAASGYALREFRHSERIVDLPTAPARKGDFLVIVRCRGQLTARRSVQLTAPLDVPDLQIVWLAPGGSEVKEGQTVARFDPSHLQQDLKEKSAALQQAQASLDEEVGQARITADQDKLDFENAVYKSERAKLEASKQAIVSALDGQKSTIDFGLAEEQVKVQQATTLLHKSSEEAKIASLRRLRDAAHADVDLTKERLSQMEMKSPLDGVINYVSNYSQGWMNAQPFKVGDHAFPGAVIAEVPDLSTLEMESKVDEADRGKIRIGDAVLVHVDAFPEKVLPAKLTSISPLTELSFNEWPPTRSFRAYASLAKRDARMRPDMNAGADIVQSKILNAISIPAKALFTFHEKPTVYVKKKNTYLPVQVTVQARNPDEIAVEGIPAGALVALTQPGQDQR